MKIIYSYITLLWIQLLVADASRTLDSLSDYLESHDLTGVGNTKHCFVSYLPQLEQVGDTWSKEYNACVQNATTVRGDVLTKVDGVQQIIRKSAQGIDSYIENCLAIEDVLDFFNCFGSLVRIRKHVCALHYFSMLIMVIHYTRQSKQQLTNMYEISFNASENALSLTQQLNGIEAERYLCTNRTEENYVLGTANVFDALDKCLQQAAANVVKIVD
ncbi:uncharacterized protein LOC133842096 isoform X1 [Drosophila sulfurigaster albostrigata]|uniref:uncharacterized protein LOC133842096 isoform X1 n=1 Tax=Drosophila sulfurigaster albostrigata TaxID=89887 RepID=UPI002D21B845|nr:uncharacterized protein LOC133842096 isoform X1 [Drosophila sulfurigaster albostrigata]